MNVAAGLGKEKWHCWQKTCTIWEMHLPPLARWRSGVIPMPRGPAGLGELTVAGTIANSAGIPRDRRRVFGQWALVYIVGGRGTYVDDQGIEERVGAGSWILVSPAVPHAYGRDPGETWHELYLCFRGPLFELWRTAGFLNPRRPVGQWLPPERGRAEFEKFFSQAARRDCSPLAAVCAWQALLAKIFEHAIPGPAIAQPGWLDRAFDLLEKPEALSQLRLEGIARECGMGYESFRKKFRQATGQSPARYAHGRRIERACRLIAMHSPSNKALAELLGFYDEFHFSKTFSQFTGMTPREYRRRQL